MEENPYAAPRIETSPTIQAGSGLSQSPYGPYREINGLGWTVIGLLIVGSLVAAAQIFALSLLNDANLRWENDPEAEADVDRWIEIANTVGYAEGLSFVVTLVLWCVWKNKSCKNAWLFRAKRIGPLINNRLNTSTPITPGWAVGWYFIPIAYLWKPFQAMTFIRDQVEEHFKGGPILGLWWPSWLIMYHASGYLTRESDSLTTEAVNEFNERLMIDSGLTIVASIPAAILIYTLSKAQRDQAKALKLRAQRS